MRTRRIIFVLAVAAIVVAPFAYGGLIPHLLYGKRIAGKVVDAETGQPIRDAYVSLLWESTITPGSFSGHGGRDICYHAASTRTDLNGRFEIEQWTKWSRYDVSPSEPYMMVYAPAYEPAHGLVAESGYGGSTSHVTISHRLKRFNGTRQQRLEMLFWNLANRGCAYGGDTQKSLYPMLRAIYREAKPLAKTPDENRTVQSIAEFAADAALAKDPNAPISEVNTRKFIRENLQK